MFSHLKLTSEFLNETDKLVLVEGSLMLLIRKDLSVTRRVNQWLFGKPDNENKYQLTEKNQFVIEYLVNGFVYAFKVSFPINPRTLQLMQRHLRFR
jgi:hypothetical protein